MQSGTFIASNRRFAMLDKLAGKTPRGRTVRLAMACLISSICFATFQTILRVNVVPESYMVRLPEFKGRIFDHSQVHPGTFNIEEDFAFIYQWGSDGILTYRAEGNEIVFEMWNPDNMNANGFRYDKVILPPPEGWKYYRAEVLRDGDYLVVSPIYFRAP